MHKFLQNTHMTLKYLFLPYFIMSKEYVDVSNIMKFDRGLIIAFLCTSVLIGCKFQQDTHSQQITAPIINTHLTQNALDWAGDYEGMLPCADCIGIKTEIKLNHDQTYVLKETYLSKTSYENTTTGNFYFDSNQPSILVLDQQANSRKFFVAENFIEARNLDGTEITSILKPHYKLNKLSYPNL